MMFFEKNGYGTYFKPRRGEMIVEKRIIRHEPRRGEIPANGDNKFIMKINAIFFIPLTVPLTPEGGTMVDGHADVWGAMVPPSGVRGAAENVAINILRNLPPLRGFRHFLIASSIIISPLRGLNRP